MPTVTTASPVSFRYANRVVAGLILLSNFYFLALNYLIISIEGGPMGFGFMIVPFLLATHAFLIPAAMALTRKWCGSTPLFVLNLIGLLYSMGLLYFLLFAANTR